MYKQYYFKFFILVAISVKCLSLETKYIYTPSYLIRQPLTPELHVFKSSQSSLGNSPYIFNTPLRIRRNDAEKRPLAGATANRKLFVNTPVRMHIGQKVWPIVDHTVNRVNNLVTQAAESAHILKNIFREGVQKQIGFLKSAVSLKKNKIHTVLRGAVNLQEIAANKLKNFASARLNHLAAIKQKLQPPNVQPLPSIRDFKLPPPIVINHRPLLSKTVSGNYVHTYDNALPNYGVEDKNHYADMGLTSFEHFQDTVLRELEEKEERKVEATLHTLFEDEYPVAPEVKIKSKTPHSDIGLLPDSDAHLYPASSPVDNGWNPIIPDPKSPGGHIRIGSYANHYEGYSKHVKPVFESFNEILGTQSPSFASPSHDSHVVASASQKTVSVSPSHVHHTRTSSRQEGSPALSSSSSSSSSSTTRITTVTPKTTEAHFTPIRESIHMLAGGTSIHGEAKRHKVKAPGTRKPKLKMKPVNKLTTRPWTPQLEINAPKSTTIHVPSLSVVASVATPTPKPQPSTIVSIKYDAVHKKPQTFPTKFETAQSKVEAVTAKYDPTIPTTHSKTTVRTTEKKVRPAKQEKKVYGTRPTGKMSRGTIKFNDSKH